MFMVIPAQIFQFKAVRNLDLRAFNTGTLVSANGTHTRTSGPMKIAVVLNTSWNIYNFRMNFLRELQAQGHEIHTVAPVDNHTSHLTAAGFTHHPIKMDSRGANPVKDLALSVELFWAYKKIRPDVILHYTIKPNVYGTFAAALLGIPVINNVCGLGTAFLKKNMVSAVALLLYKLSFRFAKKVFFQNADDMKFFLNKKLVAKDAAGLLPGSGVDLKRFRPGAFKRNKKFTFLLISRLITDKGVLEYIAAVKKLRAAGMDARFQVLGSKDPLHKRGISMEAIDEWINGNVIEYLGTTDDVREYISQADCIVLPSYREGTSRALLEAASSGKPIIATDVPGCNNVVTDGYNGLLCKMKDADDLAAKMKELASFDDDVLEQFGKNGRQKMEAEYDESVVIHKYMDALQALNVQP
jgi:glycosyltransferase involved in cell wall biosynthesis